MNEKCCCDILKKFELSNMATIFLPYSKEMLIKRFIAFFLFARDIVSDRAFLDRELNILPDKKFGTF